MSIIELAPCDHTLDPVGVLHLVSQNPEDYQTLCGTIIRKNWTISDETLKGAATCLPCRRELASRRANVELGNYMAIEGVDLCGNCGSRNWANDYCASCGAEWTPDTREGDEL
jgi:hypothetical protein